VLIANGQSAGNFRDLTVIKNYFYLKFDVGPGEGGILAFFFLDFYNSRKKTGVSNTTCINREDPMRFNK
jgi:hypothetical protein